MSGKGEDKVMGSEGTGIGWGIVPPRLGRRDVYKLTGICIPSDAYTVEGVCDSHSCDK